MIDKIIALFSGKFSYEVAREIIEQTTAELKRLKDDEILNQSDESLIEDAIARCSFKVPTLRIEEIYTDETEIECVINEHGRYIYSNFGSNSRQIIKKHVVVFHIPFDGNYKYFQIGPSSRTLPGPKAILEAHELMLPMLTSDRSGDQLKVELESEITSIGQHLSTLERDLSTAKVEMESIARSYIPRRRAEILHNKNLVATLGFPMRLRADAPKVYKAEDVNRKISPSQSASRLAAWVPEPALDESNYQHILSVMDNMTKVMERSPQTFAKMDEEDIREHFLVQLNGQYEGQATGETFNAHGKTDILVRSEGRNIFIAECKIWRGQTSFLDAVDQLLSYLTWRDTKSALVIFNKNKGLSGVVTKIREVMDTHTHKKRGPVIQGSTRFQYIFGNPGDMDREITITVMVYDIPSQI